jgi:hypothetical protein
MSKSDAAASSSSSSRSLSSESGPLELELEWTVAAEGETNEEEVGKALPPPLLRGWRRVGAAIVDDVR